MSDQYDARNERAAPASVDVRTPTLLLFRPCRHRDLAAPARRASHRDRRRPDGHCHPRRHHPQPDLPANSSIPLASARDALVAADNRKRADAQAAASLKARQDAERERTLVLSPEDQRKRDADDLDRKHKAEQEALARQRAAADLDAEQAKERRDFAARQAEKRAQVFAPTPAEARDDNHPPTPSADRLQAGQQRQGPIYDTPRP